MIPPASLLMAASAGILLLLGTLHLWITFRGNKLCPRDAALEARLKEVSPVISNQTTMWKLWIGFNASHSFGAMLFGLVYGYLALVHGPFLFRSGFLLTVGLLLLLGCLYLGKVYWIRVPFLGIALATVLYAAALVTRSHSGVP